MTISGCYTVMQTVFICNYESCRTKTSEILPELLYVSCSLYGPGTCAVSFFQLISPIHLLGALLDEAQQHRRRRIIFILPNYTIKWWLQYN